MLRPFILSWNLRNIFENASALFPKEFCLTGTRLGEYPIDAWKSYFLEVPKNGCKKDITGRSYQAFGISMKSPTWHRKRIIILPVYTYSQYSDIEKLKVAIRYWTDISIPDDIPCVAVAIKCQGCYSENRTAQSVTVLIVWNDNVCRIISLDWTEGPLEDCITPEWYIEASPLLNSEDAFEKIQTLYENISWDNTSFSIYTIPSCLGYSLHGKMANASYSLWNHEWRYNDYAELKSDLNLVLSEIRNILLNEEAIQYE